MTLPSSRKPVLPTSPPIPATLDRSIVAHLRALWENVNVRGGVTGDPLDRAIFVRDLVESGINVTVGGVLLNGKVLPGGSAIGFPTDYSQDMTPPPAPTGFTATGGFAVIILDWDTLSPYTTNYGHTEVWRSYDSNQGNAILIATSRNGGYVDPVGAGVTAWYWIRHVNQAGVTGPYNATPGTQASSSKVMSADLAALAVEAQHLADGSVSASKLAAAAINDFQLFGSGIEPVSLVGALPNPVGYTGPSVVMLTTDWKLYRYDSTTPAWTTAVPTVDLTGQITQAQIQDGAINTAKFASGLAPVEIVGALPGTGNFEGRMVYLTTDDKLYRYTGSAWTAAVPAADVTGQLTDSQLADIAAAKVTGQLVGTQIQDGAISTAKFASGLAPVEIVGALPSTNNFEGRTVYLTTDDKLYRYTGSAWTAAVPAADVTGQLTNAQIADLAAAKVTGQLSDSQLADIAAAKITGTIVESQIANGAVSTAKFATGLTPVEIVSSLPGSGNFAGRTVFLTTDSKLYRHNGTSWVSTVPATDVTGQLTDAQISALAAAKLTGQIVGTQITDGAVTTAKIFAGAVTANELAASSVIAGKIAANAVTATEINAGAVTTAKLAAGAVTANELAANAVVAGKVAAGAISATEIAARAITVDKMVVAGSNLIPNGQFEADGGAVSAVPVGWTEWLSTGKGYVTVVARASTPTGCPTPFACQFAPTVLNDYGSLRSHGPGNQLAAGNGNGIDVKAGEVYSIDYAAAMSAGASDLNVANFRIYRIYNDGTNDFVGYSITTSLNAAKGTWITFSHELTIPANVCRIVAAPYARWTTGTMGSVWWADINIRRKADANLIVDGAVTAAKLAANSVIAGKIAAGTIVAADIASGTITATQLGANSVTATQLAALAVTAGKIAANAVTATEIDAGAVTTAKLAAGAVTANELGANAVIAGKVQAGAIGATEIATGALTVKHQLYLGDNTNLVANPDFVEGNWDGWIAGSEMSVEYDPTNAYFGNYVLRHIGTGTARAYNFDIPASEGDAFYGECYIKHAGTYTSGTLGMNLSPLDKNKTNISGSWSNFIAPTTSWQKTSVTGVCPAGTVYLRCRYYASNVVGTVYFGGMRVMRRATGNLIVDGEVTAAKLAANSVIAGKIAAGTIVAADIATGTITATQIAGGTITSTQLAANSVTATQLAANSVIAGKIQAGAVSATELASNAVTTEKLNANAVTAAKIAVGTITATELGTDSVTSDKIQANAVTSGKIAANAVTAGTIAAGIITATELAANTITTDKLVVTPGNLIPNGSWQTGDFTGWRQGTGAFGSLILVRNFNDAGVPASCPAKKCVEMTYNAAVTRDFYSHTTAYTSDTIADGIPVQPGEQYFISYYAAKSAGWVGSSMRVIAYFEKNDSTTTSVNATANHQTTVTTAWQEFTGSFTVPALAERMQIRLYTVATSTSAESTYWAAMRLVRKADSELIVDGAIIANKLAANSIAVGTAAIQNSAIVTAHIADANITQAKIALLAVDDARLANATITGAKIATGTITNALIQDATIQGAKIANATITNTQIANATIQGAKLANATIDSAQIANGAIDTAHIADAQITTAKIGDLQVTGGKIANLAVDTLQIAGNAVTIPTAAFTAGNQNTTVSFAAAQTVTFTSTGASVQVIAKLDYFVASSAGSSRTLDIEFRRGSTVLESWTWTVTDGASKDASIAVSRLDTPGSGSVTYTWQIKHTGTLGQSYVNNRSIMTLEVKK